MVSSLALFLSFFFWEHASSLSGTGLELLPLGAGLIFFPLLAETGSDLLDLHLLAGTGLLIGTGLGLFSLELVSSSVSLELVSICLPY